MGSLYGLLTHLPIWVDVLLFLALVLGLGFVGASLLVWTLALPVFLLLMGMSKVALVFVIGFLVLCNVPAIRRFLFTSPILKVLKSMGVLPAISETEKVALDAGDVWVDGELFSGKPDFTRLMSEDYRNINDEEAKFIEGPCAEVCRLTSDYDSYQEGDLSAEVWAFLKREKFFGLIIPKEYGGLGLSALGHSEVVSYLGSYSIPLAITVMVPNSLGPAELLMHYGTAEQKDYYLPRLADGRDIPCFGLTELYAGSDAGAMTSSAVVFRGEDDKLYLRVNWEKRYITLGAVATLLGLAVKLSDPDGLLGGKSGITCVLIPVDTAGVEVGRRHDPLGIPFVNSPISGKDVVVSVDQIIGGENGAGQGWKMLMESLAAGRSISLPGQAAGGVKRVTRIVGAYSRIRQQFGMSISNFEEIASELAHLGAMAYALESARVFTVGAVDRGLKPAVVSAMLKYNSTEAARVVINKAMDVCGGFGISQGPNNLLAHSYIAAPIAITVEGANILTRSMIIFGQGSIRCHPFIFREIAALENDDEVGFDQAFTGHIKHIIRNGSRALLLSLTRGRLAKVPAGPMAVHYRRLSWASASFAFLADMSLIGLGGSLKAREKITGAFADILSGMYMLTASLRRYEAEKEQSGRAHEEVVNYVAQLYFVQMQDAFDVLYANLDLPVAGKVFKYGFRVWGRLNPLGTLPDYRQTSRLAKNISTSSELRKYLTERACFVSGEGEDSALGRLEKAFQLTCKAQRVEATVKKAVKTKRVAKGKWIDQVKEAKERLVINAEDEEILLQAGRACEQAVQVDSFAVSEFKSGVLNAHQS